MALRYLILIVLLAISPFRLSAQWSLGVSGGANLSFRTWEVHGASGKTGYKHTAGWNVAAFADRILSPALAVRLESGSRLWRNRITYTYTTRNILGNTYTVENLDDESYLVWSANCMARLTPFPNKNLYFLAGPELSYFHQGIQGYSSNKPGIYDEVVPWVWVNFDNYPIRRVYYLFNFGLGKSFKLGPHSRLLVECRYQRGPENLSKNELISGKMDALQLSVGFAHVLESGKRAQ